MALSSWREGKGGGGQPKRRKNKWKKWGAQVNQGKKNEELKRAQRGSGVGHG